MILPKRYALETCRYVLFRHPLTRYVFSQSQALGPRASSLASQTSTQQQTRRIPKNQTSQQHPCHHTYPHPATLNERTVASPWRLKVQIRNFALSGFQDLQDSRIPGFQDARMPRFQHFQDSPTSHRPASTGHRQPLISPSHHHLFETRSTHVSV
jgi:hypothetical protein